MFNGTLAKYLTVFAVDSERTKFDKWLLDNGHTKP